MPAVRRGTGRSGVEHIFLANERRSVPHFVLQSRTERKTGEGVARPELRHEETRKGRK